MLGTEIILERGFFVVVGSSGKVTRYTVWILQSWICHVYVHSTEKQPKTYTRTNRNSCERQEMQARYVSHNALFRNFQIYTVNELMFYDSGLIIPIKCCILSPCPIVNVIRYCCYQIYLIIIGSCPSSFICETILIIGLQNSQQRHSLGGPTNIITITMVFMPLQKKSQIYL